MAHVLFDRVKETTTTTGTTSVALGGASTGFRTFASVMSTLDTTWYCILMENSPHWEVGLATLTNATTLARTTVLASSANGALVNFPTGPKTVFMDAPAAPFLRQAARPGFSAHKNGADQTGIPSAAEAKLTFTTEEYDDNGMFDAPNSQALITVPGKYMLLASTVITAGLVDQASNYINLRKNGVAASAFGRGYFSASGTSNQGSKAIGVLPLIVGDVVDVVTFLSGTGTKTSNGAQANTYFQGFYLCP